MARVATAFRNSARSNLTPMAFEQNKINEGLRTWLTKKVKNSNHDMSEIVKQETDITNELKLANIDI